VPAAGDQSETQFDTWSAGAQAYPSRPVRIIVAVPPGGGSDILARLMGQWLSERLGQQFLVENPPGGAGNIGTEAVVRARADGYTLLLVTNANAMNATLYEKLNFNFIRDIAPVASIMGAPFVSPMPWPIRVGSTWRPLETGRRPTWPASCSR
jgi:tripartite-type tricarboxylate transporter receptor subunit TctC